MELIVLFAAAVAAVAGNPALQEVFHWNQVDFDVQDEPNIAEDLLSSGIIEKNNLPFGLEVWQEKLFVTLPRWNRGVVSTLNYINLNDTSVSPKLRPYPDWPSNRIYVGEPATKIVSVFRVRVDECDRLWAMDTGLEDRRGNRSQITDPKILIFDLHTDQLIHQYSFGSALRKEDSLFANIVVDTNADSCDEAFAYVMDANSNAVIVYSLQSDSAYRVRHNYFFMDPLAGTFHVEGLDYQWRDGIISMALAPAREDSSRSVYFHALSSNMEFVVDTKTLKNQTAANNDFSAYKILGFKGQKCESIASVLDPRTGVLFYGLASKAGVGCWNSFRHQDNFSPSTNVVVASDEETMSLVSDLKVDREGNLWVISDRLPKFMYDELSPEEVNYRVFKGKVEDIVKDTLCEPVSN